MRKLSLLLSLVALSLQTGCNFKFDPKTFSFQKPKIEVKFVEEKAPPAPVIFTCTAALDVSFIKANHEVLVRVTGHDGEPEYKIEGTSTTFASSTMISRVYETAGSKKETLTLVDKTGKKAGCEFAVQVIEGDPTDLKCAITATPVSPHINEAVSFKVKATGGTAPYVFQNFVNADSTVAANLTASSDTEATAAGKYASAGTRNVTVQLKDDTDTVVSCSQTVAVRSAANVFLSASHSSQSADQPITVTATTEGFLPGSTFTWQWSTTESGITITPNGNVATVRSNANVNHTNFVVTAKAVASNGEQVTGNINLNFVANQPLSCTLSHSSGTFVAGDSVTFTVSASEGVEFTSFNAGNGATIVGSTASTRTVKFSTGGWKTITATAKSSSRNVSCNAGATLSDTIKINHALSCNVVTSPNWSYEGDPVYLYVSIPADTGVGSATLVDVRTVWQAYADDLHYTGSLSAWFRIWNTGSFPVEAVVRDQSGRTASCVTYHVVYPYYW